MVRWAPQHDEIGAGVGDVLGDAAEAVLEVLTKGFQGRFKVRLAKGFADGLQRLEELRQFFDGHAVFAFVGVHGHALRVNEFEGPAVLTGIQAVSKVQGFLNGKDAVIARWRDGHLACRLDVAHLVQQLEFKGVVCWVLVRCIKRDADLKPVVVGPHVSMADETLDCPIAFDRWAGGHKARRLNVGHGGTPAARGRDAVLVDGTINGIATVGEVVDVAKVHRFKAPTRALQQVSGG